MEKDWAVEDTVNNVKYRFPYLYPLVEKLIHDEIKQCISNGKFEAYVEFMFPIPKEICLAAMYNLHNFNCKFISWVDDDTWKYRGTNAIKIFWDIFID